VKSTIIKLTARVVVAAIALSLLGAGTLSAHGVTWDYSAKESCGLRFSYDDDTAMKFSEVKVFGPDDPEKLSQVGRTNEEGYFAFVPSVDGKWVVTSDDNNGHLAKAELDIKTQAPPSGDSLQDAAPAAPQVNLEKVLGQATKPYKIGLVVSVLLTLAMVFKLYGGKKSTPKAGAADKSEGKPE
jgi:hypothetical protein